MKKTRQLVASLVAIVVCFAMLLGTTYAWFTDSVINTNNIIKSGNIDVELYHTNAFVTTEEKVDGNTKLFVNVNGGEILWEPEASTSETFTIKNEGSLALQYKFSVKALSKTLNLNGDSLLDVLTYTVNGNEVAFDDVFAGTLLPNDYAEYVASIKWNQGVNDNAYANLKVLLGVELVATQFTSEFDGTGDQFDINAEYPEIPEATLIPEQATAPMTIAGAGANAPTAELPADLINALPEEVEAISLQQSEPIVDEQAKTVTFENVDFYDQNGEVVDLSNNTTPFTVTFTVPSLANMPVNVYHDDELVASVVADANGVITYEVKHFCEVTFGVTQVATADELIAALEKGESVLLTADIKINPANMSNAYGTTGINIKNGQAIFGGNHTIDIKGAGGTWDSGINTTGGLIKDLTVTGSFRGIFINHTSTHSEPVVLDNVTITGTVYTISCDQGLYQNLIAKNCTFLGWTSYAATIGNVTFENCYFGEGSGYSFCRPYAPTTFIGCEFEAGFAIDTVQTSGLVFENCKYAGTTITAENATSLITGEDLLFYKGIEGVTIR